MDDEERQRREALARLIAERAKVYGEDLRVRLRRDVPAGLPSGEALLSDRCARRDYARRRRQTEREASLG